DRRVEVASRDVAEGVDHRQNRQTEGQRDSQKTDSRAGKFRREHSASATSENQPESPYKFRRRPFHQCHNQLLSIQPGAPNNEVFIPTPGAGRFQLSILYSMPTESMRATLSIGC